ncbi:TonB-dependent receptor domain-containing protein [Flavobacteriaceae bacterium LMO-SS05]
MKFKPLFFLFCCISVFGFSQEFSVFGKVVDEQGSPISFANVLLMTQQDSTAITGTSTDDQGIFRMSTFNKNSYTIKISFIGYIEVLKAISLEGDLNLGTITLQEETQSLEAVTLVFKRPTLKKEADRLVFNVENSALIEGNMLQVLKSTPGVMVLNNTISVKNSTPTIYINNKKVNISASELTQLLESSSANAVKSIEVITNPSAKYDASSGVVVNIVMSKNLVTGYRGNVFANYTQGVFPIYNGGTSHFFKSEKINFYANYSYTDSKVNRDDSENINYFDDNQNIDEYWQSETNRNKWTQTHTFNVNFDYAINNNNTLSLSSNMLLLPHYKYKKANTTNVFDAAKNLDFYYDSNNLEQDKKHNLGFDLGFVHQFSKGELSLNAHFTDYNYKQNQNVVSNYYEDDGSFIETTAFNTINNQNTEIIAGKVDYHLPVSDAASFETGIKTSRIETNSATSQYDIVNGQEVLDVNNTDDFDYREEIQAAYVNYSKGWEKWDITLGLRAEQTNIKSKSIFNNQTNTQDYLDWFPAASVSFKPIQKLSLYTNYKRSIERPNYQNLNPFRFFYNDNNAFVGNPNLKSIITDHMVFGTSILDHFVLEAYYKNINNNIYVLPRQDNTTKSLLFTPLNFDKTIEYGFDFGVNFYAAKDWSIYFLTSFYNIEDQTVFDANVVNQNQWSNYSVLQNSFTFLKDRSLNANVTVYYVGKNLQGFRIVEDRWVSSFSISKSIMGKKAVISLVAEDLFNSQDYNDSTRYLNQFSSIRTSLDSRLIKLGFRYNFGNTNLKTNSQTKDIKERERLKENN